MQIEVESLGVDAKSNTPVVFLREQTGNRVLPIWIGPGEASAIAMHLAEVAFSRPLTHDLLAQLIQTLGGTLRRVVISRVEDATYFAELVVEQGKNTFSIDARPSDSIALALRLEAPIFADATLFDRVEIVVAEGDAEDPEDQAFGSEAHGSEASDEEPSPMTPEALAAYLRTLDPEDFGRFMP